MSLLIIERKSVFEWEEFAHPGSDINQALEDLKYFKALEIKKRYQRPLRLVRITREILAE